MVIIDHNKLIEVTTLFHTGGLVTMYLWLEVETLNDVSERERRRRAAGPTLGRNEVEEFFGFGVKIPASRHPG
jgi:hypothetical protein